MGRNICKLLRVIKRKEIAVMKLSTSEIWYLRKLDILWSKQEGFLLHDNDPPHRAPIVKKHLDRHSVTTLEHPPYSPDLAPADFYLFPRLKMKLKGHRFVDSDEVIENAKKQLKDLSKNGFQECFEQLHERWEKCVDAGGKNFEGQ
ncbi:hypothetical protein AVEN_13542-1 [Araneus ventricosus]|uniref:Histone-lysine N-methyltransferase SETMAR n=1 Tax=Araneus ventricosus TaxID=182803 RepID=A0A4Y2D5C4_ARAVE|nr:hypothetical protein AVEN_13542-1 [Araneus ventricosus]